MKTYIVMPHYHRVEETIELAKNAINSIYEATEDFVLINVDDGSLLEMKYKGFVLSLPYNHGFAKACNKGLKYAMDMSVKNGEEDCFIICANNDIEVYKGWQNAITEPFSLWDNVAITGLVASKEKTIEQKDISLYNKGVISEGGLLWDRMQNGGLWCSTRKVLEKIGLFDEQFEIGGMEDVDLFLRARDTFGMKIIMSARAMIWHKEGATRWHEQIKSKNKAAELENERKFRQKWGYDYHSRQVWRQNIIFNE